MKYKLLRKRLRAIKVMTKVMREGARAACESRGEGSGGDR
jgi:hypothetical protein